MSLIEQAAAELGGASHVPALTTHNLHARRLYGFLGATIERAETLRRQLGGPGDEARAEIVTEVVVLLGIARLRLEQLP